MKLLANALLVALLVVPAVVGAPLSCPSPPPAPTGPEPTGSPPDPSSPSGPSSPPGPGNKATSGCSAPPIPTAQADNLVSHRDWAVYSVDGELELDLAVRPHSLNATSFSFTSLQYCIGATCGAPGPTLMVKPGDSVRIRVSNELSSSYTELAAHVGFYLYGLRVAPSGNVFNRTVTPGSTEVFAFRIRDDHVPGSHWYYSNVNSASALHVMGGLLGPIVVRSIMPSGAPSFDALGNTMEVVTFTHHPMCHCNGGKDSNYSLETYPHLHSVTSAPYAGTVDVMDPLVSGAEPVTDVVLANGGLQPKVQLRVNDWRQFDLIAAVTDIVLRISIAGSAQCEAVILAVDGILLNEPQTFTVYNLPPGGRVSLAIGCAYAGEAVIKSEVPSVSSSGTFPPELGFNQDLVKLLVGGTASNPLAKPNWGVGDIKMPWYLNGGSAGASVPSTIHVAARTHPQGPAELGIGTDCPTNCWFGSVTNTSVKTRFTVASCELQNFLFHGVEGYMQFLHVSSFPVRVDSRVGGAAMPPEWGPLGAFRDTMMLLPGQAATRSRTSRFAGPITLQSSLLSAADRGMVGFGEAFDRGQPSSRNCVVTFDGDDSCQVQVDEAGSQQQSPFLCPAIEGNKEGCILETGSNLQVAEVDWDKGGRGITFHRPAPFPDFCKWDFWCPTNHLLTLNITAETRNSSFLSKSLLLNVNQETINVAPGERVVMTKAIGDIYTSVSVESGFGSLEIDMDCANAPTGTTTPPTTTAVTTGAPTTAGATTAAPTTVVETSAPPKAIPTTTNAPTTAPTDAPPTPVPPLPSCPDSRATLTVEVTDNEIRAGVSIDVGSARFATPDAGPALTEWLHIANAKNPHFLTLKHRESSNTINPGGFFRENRPTVTEGADWFVNATAARTEMIATGHVTLSPVPDYSIEVDESAEIYIDIEAMRPCAEPEAGAKLAVVFVIVRSTYSPGVKDYMTTAITAAQVAGLTSVAVGTGGMAKTLDAQGMTIFGLMSCAQPLQERLLKNARMVSPAALTVTLEGMFAGNMIVIAAVMFLHTVIVLIAANVFSKSDKSGAMIKAKAMLYYPSLPYAVITALYSGTAFVSFRFLYQWDSLGGVVSGMIGCAIVLVVPVASVYYCARLIDCEYHKYTFDREDKKKFNMLWVQYLFPNGRWRPGTVVKMDSSIFVEMQRPSPLWVSHIFWAPLATAIVAAIEPGSENGCQLQYGVIGWIHLFMAIVGTVLRPWRLNLENVLAVFSSCTLAISAWAIAAEYTTYRGANLLETLTAIEGTLTLLRILALVLVIYLEWKTDTPKPYLLKNLSNQKTVFSFEWRPYKKANPKKDDPLDDDPFADSLDAPMLQVPTKQVAAQPVPVVVPRPTSPPVPLPPANDLPYSPIPPMQANNTVIDPFDDTAVTLPPALQTQDSFLLGPTSPTQGPPNPMMLGRADSIFDGPPIDGNAMPPIQGRMDSFLDGPASPIIAAGGFGSGLSDFDPAAPHSHPGGSNPKLQRRYTGIAEYVSENGSDDGNNGPGSGLGSSNRTGNPLGSNPNVIHPDVAPVMSPLATLPQGGGGGGAGPVPNIPDPSGNAMHIEQRQNNPMSGSMGKLRAAVSLVGSAARNAIPPNTTEVDVWRIEHGNLVAQPKTSLGTFYDGDSYAVLVTKTEWKSARESVVEHTLTCWIGGLSTPDETDGVLVRAAEMEPSLTGSLKGPWLRRVSQSNEDKWFLSAFPEGLRVVAGGIDSKQFTLRLFHVSGSNMKNIKVKQVRAAADSLNEDDVFIADCGETIFVFQGVTCSPGERNTARTEAERMAEPRAVCLVKIVNSTDAPPEFWKPLGGKIPLPADSPHRLRALNGRSKKKLMRIHGSVGRLSFERVAMGDAVDPSRCKSDGVFVFDLVDEVVVWVGKKVSGLAFERGVALQKGVEFIAKNNLDSVPITRVVEGEEPPNFLETFVL